MTAVPRVREATPEDAGAIAALAARSADGGAVAFRAIDHVPAGTALRPGTERLSVVAELPGAGIVGAAAIGFGRFRYAGAEHPYALLNSLAVDPDHRGQGVAKALATWRLERAERELGADAVILADIQGGNAASRAVARHWATGFTTRMLIVPAPMRHRPPRLPADVVVRDADAADVPGIISHLTERAAARDFARIWTPESLAAWLAATPFAEPIARYRVATDRTGRLIGGIALRDDGRLRSMEVTHMAAAIRAANLVMRVVPREGVLRNVTVEHLWHVPGREDAAAALYQQTRWLDRDHGNTLLSSIDARDPIRRCLGMLPWSPTTTTVAAVRAAVPPSPDRLVEPLL